MINKYLNKIKKDFENAKWDARIKNYDDSPFPQILSDKLEIKPLQDESEVVFFTNTHKANKVMHRKNILDDSWLLPAETKMVFSLYLNNKLASVTVGSAKGAVQRALSVLTQSTHQPHTLTQHKYTQCIKKAPKSSIARFNKFINWCVENQYCEEIRTKHVSTNNHFDGAKRNKKKLPDESSIIALGDIFCQTIPENKECWNTSVNSNQANALSSMYSALCLASPNRMCAEIITLQKQNLITDDKENKEEEPVTLHSLMWQGSKKHKENQNHIGSWMAEQIERGIDYFDLVTQPYRVLANFWVNQECTIQELFPIMNETVQQRLITTKLTTTDSPSFIQLGYLLGFYDNDYFQVNTKGKRQHKSNVHISELTLDFRVCCTRDSGVGKLLGFSHLSPNCSIIKNTHITLGQFHSIKELQLATFQDMIKN